MVQLIAEGHTNKQIASSSTSASRRWRRTEQRIMRKLKLHSSAEVVRYAVRNKLLEA